MDEEANVIIIYTFQCAFLSSYILQNSYHIVHRLITHSYKNSSHSNKHGWVDGDHTHTHKCNPSMRPFVHPYLLDVFRCLDTNKSTV